MRGDVKETRVLESGGDSTSSPGPTPRSREMALGTKLRAFTTKSLGSLFLSFFQLSSSYERDEVWRVTRGSGY